MKTTITYASMNAHQRREFRLLQEILNSGNEPPRTDWKKRAAKEQRRKRALTRILKRTFDQGGCAREGKADYTRQPGQGTDTLHDSSSLADLLACRAFGFGSAIHLEKP